MGGQGVKGEKRCSRLEGVQDTGGAEDERRKATPHLQMLSNTAQPLPLQVAALPPLPNSSSSRCPPSQASQVLKSL